MTLSNGILTLSEEDIREAVAIAYQKAHPGQRVDFIMFREAGGGDYELFTLEAVRAIEQKRKILSATECRSNPGCESAHRRKKRPGMILEN